MAKYRIKTQADRQGGYTAVAQVKCFGIWWTTTVLPAYSRDTQDFAERTVKRRLDEHLRLKAHCHQPPMYTEV